MSSSMPCPVLTDMTNEAKSKFLKATLSSWLKDQEPTPRYPEGRKGMYTHVYYRGTISTDWFTGKYQKWVKYKKEWTKWKDVKKLSFWVEEPSIDRCSEDKYEAVPMEVETQHQNETKE